MTSDRPPHTPVEVRENHELTITTRRAVRWTCTCGDTAEFALARWTTAEVLNGAYLHLVEPVFGGEVHYLDDDVVLRFAAPPPGG